MNFYDADPKPSPRPGVPPAEFPSFSHVMAARKAIDSYIYETPLITSVSLSKQTGHHKILLKCENLQRTGSYHYRGFIYKVIRAKERDLLVSRFVTYAAANGGPALACAAEDFQSTADVVVPRGAPALAQTGVRHYRGVLHPCAASAAARDAALRGLLRPPHAAVVDAYHDPDVLAGFATVGLELMLQTDCEVDCVVAPVGGGALINALALAVRGMRPNVAVFGAVGDPPPAPLRAFRYAPLRLEGEGRESGGGDDDDDARAAVVGEGTPAEGHVTGWNFDHMRKLVNGVLRVTAQDIAYAFRYVYERCKLVIDLKAATAVAAVLARPRELQHFQCIAIVLSGGNVDLLHLPAIATAAL